MTNPYYNHGSFPATGSAGASASMRAELDSITAGFNKLPTLTANNVVFVNASGTALEARAGIDGVVIGGTTPAAGTFTTLTLTSGFVLPLGSVGAPSLSFASDSNNGWWSPGADIQAWSTAGLERMRLLAAGGLSFSAPTSGDSLTVASASGSRGVAISSAVASDAVLSLAAISYAREYRLKALNSDGSFRIRDETGGADRFVVTNAGDVGVFAAPLQRFWVQSGAASAIGVIQDADGSPLIGGYTQAGAGKKIRIAGNVLSLSGNGSNVDHVLVDTSGNVSIGAASPGGIRLNVSSSTGVWAQFGASSLPASYMQFLRGGSAAIGGYLGFDGGALLGTGTGTSFVVRSEADLILAASAAEKLRVNSSGQITHNLASVGIAGNSGTMLTLLGNTGTYVSLKTSGTQEAMFGADTSGVVLGAFSNHSVALRVNNTDRVTIDTGGRVGVGATPQAWGSNRSVIELGGASDFSYVFGQNSVNLHENVYYDGTNFRSVRAAVGAAYQITADTHNWFSASNGGAGGISTLTQRLWLDANGQLGVSVSPTAMLDVSKAGTNIFGRFRAAAGFFAGVQICGNNTTAGTTSFDLQQDSSGNVDIVQRNNARLSLYANNTEWLRLAAAGTFDLLAGAGSLRVNSHISRFESAEQSVPTTTFASNTLTHGGSRVPDISRLVLRCKTAELGYSVGDEVDVTLHNHTMTDRGFNVWHSTTQTGYVWITGLNVAPSLSHKTTGTMTTVTAANWRVVVYNHWL